MGSVGEALLYAVLFLLGVVGLVVMIASAQLRLWPSSYFFPELYFVEVRTVVADKFLVESKVVDNVQNDSSPEASTFRPELLVEWMDDGVVRSSRLSLSDEALGREAGLAMLDRYEQGESYQGWRDLFDEQSLRMRRPQRYRFGLTLIAFVVTICLGGAGAVHAVISFGTSPERRAVIVGKAARIDVEPDSVSRENIYPNVPAVDDMSNSPGVHLAYRLPIVQSPLLRVLAAALFCLVWVSIAAVFVNVTATDFVRGEPEWFLGLVTLVFVGLGVWSFRYFWSQLSFAASVGPTSVEISDHPLLPGSAYQIVLTQAGRVNLEYLDLRLVCQEEATFREGTDIRTELRQVHEQEIFVEEDITLLAGKPFEHQDEFQVDADVMHSFQGENNCVHWKVVLTGSVSGVKYLRQFPVVVFPNGRASSVSPQTG